MIFSIFRLCQYNCNRSSQFVGNIWSKLHFIFKRCLKPVKHHVKSICKSVKFIIAFSKVNPLWQVIPLINFFCNFSNFFNWRKGIFSNNISSNCWKYKKKRQNYKRNVNDRFNGTRLSNIRHYSSNPYFSITSKINHFIVNIPLLIMTSYNYNFIILRLFIIHLKSIWRISIKKFKILIINGNFYILNHCIKITVNYNFSIFYR